MQEKQVGIIGCGWLGLPLAKSFIFEGYSVKGTTTNLDKIVLLKSFDIVPYHISLSEKKIKGPISNFLENLSYIIINIPPGLRGSGIKESYVQKIHLLHKEIKKSALKQIIFISSTSVYGAIYGMVDEHTHPKPTTASGIQLLAAENIFKQDMDLKTTIIRFAGLIGPSRHPITTLSNKNNLVDGNAPVNLIHLNDCIKIIKHIILENKWDEIFNGVHPEHPKKRVYYTKIAHDRGLKIPQYNEDNSENYKIINTCSPFLVKKSNFFTSLYG